MFVKIFKGRKLFDQSFFGGPIPEGSQLLYTLVGRHRGKPGVDGRENKAAEGVVGKVVGGCVSPQIIAELFHAAAVMVAREGAANFGADGQILFAKCI